MEMTSQLDVIHGGKLFWLVDHVVSLIKLNGYTSKSI